MMRGTFSSGSTLEEVNLDELQSLFVEAQENVSLLAGKEFVLVIGKKGVGKSTLVNYLLEYPLSLVVNPDTVIEADASIDSMVEREMMLTLMQEN